MIYSDTFYKTVSFTKILKMYIYKDWKNVNENTVSFDFVHVTTSKVYKVYGRSLIDFLIPFIDVLK